MLGCTVDFAPAHTQQSPLSVLEHSSVFITLALGIKSPASPNQVSSFLRGSFVTSVLVHIAAFFQFAPHHCNFPAHSVPVVLTLLA